MPSRPFLRVGHICPAHLHQLLTHLDAGKQPGSWKIIYQMPPQIVPTAKKMKVSEHGWSRQDYYGLPVKDEDVDYIDATILLHLDSAMRRGIERATLARQQRAQNGMGHDVRLRRLQGLGLA
ncbi:MAG: hypothetical protein WBZ04_11645 [Candidatus Nanopelagicales bacterium]